MTTKFIVNERITAKQVRLIIDEKMIGVVSLRDALNQARDRGLDLVQITETDEPVCRILDADRYRYERAKHEREQSRKQRELVVDTKEIQLRPVTGIADIATKAKKARVFLESGDKVKVTVKFKGREKSHKDEGRRIIEQFLAEIGEHKIDKPLSEGDSDMIMIIGSMTEKSEKNRKTKEIAV